MSKDAYDRCVAGVDDTTDNDFLLGARYAIVNRLDTREARWVINVACDRYGPETVYMDGEIYDAYAGWRR